MQDILNERFLDNGLLYFRPYTTFFFYKVTHVQVFQTLLLLNASFLYHDMLAKQ